MNLNPLRFFARPEPVKPKTIDSRVVGQKLNYFGTRKNDYSKNRNIYEQGGVVSEAIDCHPLFMFTNGYKFDGDEKLVAKVQEVHDNIGFEEVAWKLIVDALVVDKGIAEVLPGKGANIPIAGVYRRPAEEFEPILDDYGRVVKYKQTVKKQGMKSEAAIDPKYIFKLDLGLPLVSRCMDDIVRHTKVVDAVSESIHRHGFPRHVVEVGQIGETIPDAVLNKIGVDFEELKPNHELVVQAGVKISNIDTMGITNTKLYVDFAIQELCAALGTPEEMLGLGRGSTEATANVRLQAWYDRIGTLQRRFAAQWNREIVDKITGVPGRVKLVFGDANPTDDFSKAQGVATLLGLIEPPITINEARQMLGLKPLENEDELPDKSDTSQDTEDDWVGNDQPTG